MAQCQLVQVNCWAAVRVIKTRCVGRRSPSLLLLCGVSCVFGVHVCVSRYVITESILYYLLLHFFLFGSGASSSRSVAVLGATVSQRERAVRVGACWVLTLLVLHLSSWRPGVFWSWCVPVCPGVFRPPRQGCCCPGSALGGLGHCMWPQLQAQCEGIMPLSVSKLQNQA